MKKKQMLILAISLCLLSLPKINFCQTLNLGILSTFEGYTGAGAATNEAGATWTGDVGTNIGIISGFGAPPFFNGNTYNANAVTAQCRVDLFRVYIHLNDLFVDYPATHAPAFGGGETITPGVYSIGGAGSIGGVLTLDGGGNPNAFFVIKFYGAMTVGAGAVVNLSGGTKSSNVFFIADGAISVAADARIKGTLFAKIGAVGLGAGAVLEGRMLTLEGAIVAGVNATVSRPLDACTIPIFCENNCSPTSAVDVLGVLSNFALYTNAGAVPNTSTSGIDGNIGTNAGAISGFESSVVVGSYHTADASTAQANIALDNAYNSLMALPNTVTAHPAVFGSVGAGGETINAGVYFIDGAGSLGGTLVLDGQNNTNAIFVFKFAGAFSVAAQAKMILLNGARRCNVFFIGGAGVATGAISIGAGAVLKGTFLSHGGACGSGAGVFLSGRQLSTGGAVNTYSGIIFNNPVCVTSMSLAPPVAPTGNASQSFCSATNPTVADLTATGSNIQWYAASSGGSPLAASTVLTTATHFYASQTTNNSESTTRFEVTATVNVTPGAPTGNASQTYCSATYPKVSDLVVTATGTVIWYTAAPGGSVVASTTALVNGTHYFASQTTNNCESTTRFDVTVIVNTAPEITTQPTAPTATCSGTGTQTLSVTATGTDLTYSWRRGGVALTNGTVISGQGTNTLTLTSPTTSYTGSYDVIVSGTCTPSVTSSVVLVTVNSAPTISATDITGVYNGSGMCNASVSFGSNVSTTGTPTPTLTYKINSTSITSPYIFPVGTTTVTVYSTNSCTAASTTFNVTVTDNQNPTIATASAISVTSDAGVCTYASSQLTAPTSADNCSVASVVATPASLVKGPNMVTWTVTDGSGNTATSTATVTVSEQALPNAGTNGTLTVCSGTTPSNTALFTALNGTPTAGGSWTNSGLVYTYTVAATAPCTVAATATVTVSITSVAQPILGSVVQPTCSVSTGSFTITNYNAAYTYSATPGTGVTITGATVTAAAGTYTITATLGVCSSIASASVTVNAQPATPSAPTTGTVTQPTCSVATGSFTITNYNAAYTYSATPGTGVTITGATVTAAAGTYTITATLGVCSSIASASVTVNAQPATPSAPTTAGTQPTCSVATGAITVTSSTTGLTFSIDGSNYSNATGIFSGLLAGTYNLTARNNIGCTSSATKVTVNAQPATPGAPTGTASQVFCSATNPTVSNLVVTATGTVICYTAATGGSVVATTTALVNGTHYYASQTTSNCESTTRFDVTVTINTAPIVSTTDITTNNALNICTASVTMGSNITATGTPVPTITYSLTNGGASLANPYSFSVGTTTVFAKATNSCGSDTKSFTVTVKDNVNPTITAPAAVATTTNSGCTATGVALGTPITGDNCGVKSVTNNAPTAFPIGTTTVTWTVTDGSGNTATATQTVIVTDNVAPTITAPAATTGTTNVACTSTNVTLGSPTVADNCTATASLIVTNNAPTAFPIGTTTVTWTVKDATGNTATATQTVIVTDNVKPTLATLAAISVTSDAGVCTYASSQLTKPTAADNCSVASVVATPASLVLGLNTVTWTVTDGSGNTATSTQTVNVNSIKTTTTVTVSPNSSQYSDAVTFVATVTNCSGNATGGIVTFKVGTQTMGTAPVLADGTAKLIATLNEQFVTAFTPPATPTGQMSPGVKTVNASFAAINSSQASTGTTSLIITQEDAIPYYTGSSFVSTASTSSTSAPILLSAKVKDTSALAGSGDNKPGNISNARVRFVNRDVADPMNINAVTSATGYYISDWLTPGLVIATDTTTGIVSANWSAPIGSSDDGTQFTLGIIVDNGYYFRNSSTDDAVITVSKPLTNFVTGGGYIIMTNAIGSINPQQGLRNNFGFNIKSNTNGVLNGNINSIVRCTNGKVYQIKSNAMSSLSVTPATSTSGAKAVFTGKANWQDITNPSKPIPAFSGTNLLQVTMTDRGEPGNTDDISIIVWDNSNNLLFSSKWDGTRTVPQILDGGNIKIHNSASVITGSAQSNSTITSSLNPAVQGVSVTFTATITSSNTIKPTGTVTFVDVSNNNLVLATIALSTTGIVAYSTSNLTVGTHSIVAYYSGDSRYGVSSNQLAQLISGVTPLSATPIVVAKVATPKEVVRYIPLQIAIGPVPSNSKFTLQVLSSSNEVIDMIILDISGQVIQKIMLAKGSTIDFGSNYRAGSYFVQVIQGKQKVLRKIIKF